MKASQQLAELAALIATVQDNAQLLDGIDRAAEAVCAALARGNKVLTCGNGGSATDAAHLAEELVGRYRVNRVALPAINLSADGAALTCIANDFGFDEVFARQIEALGKQDDVLVAFTTSGRSENINRALRRAKEHGLVTIAFSGKGGGEAASIAEISVVVPHQASERIQEIHTFAMHVICEAAEARFGSA